MKRILASCVLAGLIVAISVGCGGDSKPSTPAAKPAPGGAGGKMDAKPGDTKPAEKK